jgi:hypothetical protein
MKVYPDHTLELALRALCAKANRAGPVVLWEMKGPLKTQVAWLVAYEINGKLVIVETFKDGSWTAFANVVCVSPDDDATTATIHAVASHCGVDEWTTALSEK